MLHVGPDEVFIEDLGSHNGIAVNGIVRRGSFRLSHMDRIYLGSQELVLIDGAKLSNRPDATPGVLCESCGVINTSTERLCRHCGTSLDGLGGVTLREPKSSDSSDLFAWGAPEDTRSRRPPGGGRGD